MFPIQNYFGFLSDVYNWVLDLKAKLGREDESNNKFIYIVDTYQFSRNNVKEIRPLLNFAKPDPSQFTIPLSNWLKKYSELKIITDLYSDVIYREGNSPTVQFLLLVQACEHYHSIRFNNNLETKETYNLKVKEVLNSIDKKHKVWLNDAVRNANNKTLKIMLTELFADNILIFKSVISDIDKIVQKIGDTRNYYTHFNKALKHKISVGEELNFLIAILLLLLKSIILKELGIDQLNTLYALKGQGIHRAAIEKSRILGFLK